ncbi:MAG TPA: hypothetical protein VEX86_07370 [Longimicrobium sp.]|nr:hypothetical protein [Longimicrobium sp.]
MMRAAAFLVALVALSAAPAPAQDSTSAAAPAQVRPRATQPRRAPRPPATPTRTQARDTTGDTTRAAVRPPTPTPPPGFEYQSRTQPDTVTVGDRFESGMVVNVPAGTQVALEIARDTADRWRVLDAVAATPRDSARSRWLVVAKLVAWQPGLPDTIPASMRLTGADGRVIELPVKLAFPVVRAVLPDDTTKWRVRPPHDVWGPSRDPARMALLGALLLLALLLLALLGWMIVRAIRRRRARAVPANARDRALAQLERARTSGFVEAGNWKAFYTLISEALRGFVAALEPRLSEDLTSAEVVEGMRARGVPDERVETLEHLLRVSDLAKFARHGRSPDDARRDLDRAREWVQTYPLPSGEPDAVDEPLAAEAAP